MIKQVELVLLPEEAADKSIQLQKASEQLAIPETEITFLKPLKRSIDARSRKVKINLNAANIPAGPAPTMITGCCLETS